ncbi:MAG: hypothetical protein IRY91_11695, partial [Gemmatimonadaceae bacterium]|nr:hypothetical protein [Gemmatimonadaceae bacterium]
AAPGARTWFGGDRYQDASELAFHLPGHPTTFSLNLGGRANAYDAWPAFPERARPGDDLVLALEITAHGNQDSVAVLLRPHFERAQLVSTVGLYRGRERREERHIWVLHGWRGTWPAVACRSCLPGRGPGTSAHGRSSVLASPVR